MLRVIDLSIRTSLSLFSLADLQISRFIRIRLANQALVASKKSNVGAETTSPGGFKFENFTLFLQLVSELLQSGLNLRLAFQVFSLETRIT